jgi:hypothetical protein
VELRRVEKTRIMAAKEDLFKELAQQKELREKRGPERLKDWGESLSNGRWGLYGTQGRLRARVRSLE